MKYLKSFIICLISCSTYAQMDHDDIKVLSATDGFFHFKLSQRMIGSTVEVLDNSNTIVSKQVMDSRKLFIDFFEAKPGTYQIKISGSAGIKCFEYVLLEDKGQNKEDYIELAASTITFHKSSL